MNEQIHFDLELRSTRATEMIINVIFKNNCNLQK